MKRRGEHAGMPQTAEEGVSAIRPVYIFMVDGIVGQGYPSIWFHFNSLIKIFDHIQ
jgi:hypothetical protein